MYIMFVTKENKYTNRLLRPLRTQIQKKKKERFNIENDHLNTRG